MDKSVLVSYEARQDCYWHRWQSTDLVSGLPHCLAYWPTKLPCLLLLARLGGTPLLRLLVAGDSVLRHTALYSCSSAHTATSYLTCGIGQRGEESKDTTEERTEASMQSRSGTPSPRATSPSPSPPCHRRGDRETTFSVSRYLWVSPLAINQFSESQ